MKTRIYCLGDSVTRGFGAEQGGGVPYPTYLQEKLNQAYGDGVVMVRNGGRDGYGAQKNTVFPACDGVGSGYYGKDSNWQDIVDFAPDIVIFSIGGNNAKIIGDEKSWVDTATFRADYRELLERTLALPTQPQVIVGTSTGVKGAGNFGVSPSVVAENIVPVQREVAAELALELVDGFALSQSFLENGFHTDNVHLNAVGYEKLAQLYFTYIFTRNIL